jgi:subtilisin family serine protease
VQEYLSCFDVVYAEPNWIVYPCGIPNDANFSIQWHLHNTGQVFLNYLGHNCSGTPDADIDGPEAWDLETGSRDVVIAIADSGIDYTHPDLAANIWNNTDEIPNNGIDDDGNGYIDDIRGWDFYYDNNNVTDGNGHGTMCAGVAGAVGDNEIWGAGVAWNCKIMPVRIANELWYSSNSVAGPGIRYAADNGADIISMSFGFPYSTFMLDALNYAYGKGVFLCAAAGNANNPNEFYPAAYDNVTAVAATDQYDTRVTPNDFPGGWGSNYGDWVEIAAPGNIIFTTMPTYHVYFNDLGANQNFDWGCGTSFASPMVAGVAALLLSVNSSLSPDEIKSLLCENVDPYNSTEYIGTGRLNAQKALIVAIPQPPNPPAIDGTANGKIKQLYNYTFNSTDPNGDDVYYFIDWGDQTNSSWIGPYPSGDVITRSHSWSKKGTYKIQAKAKDVYGNESGWASLSVKMPCSYNIPMLRFLERLFERFPHVFPILRHLLGY